MLTQADMPKYTCHKVVHAAKVTEVQELGVSFTYLTTDYGGFNLSNGRGPFEIGGYVVLYEDGFTSYSPAKAFEDGYKLTA